MKTVNSLEEAKAHFAESIDTVTAVKGDESVEITTLDEAKKLYAETTEAGGDEEPKKGKGGNKGKKDKDTLE